MRLCGIDEVGRGALAGPLVGCGIVFNLQFTVFNQFLNDSKKLNLKQRQNIYELILRSDTTVCVETISARLINKYGIGWANKEIFRRLILNLKADKYILDGNLKIRVRGKTKLVQSLVKADGKVPEVMAASIVAKVTRDKLMCELAQKYSCYGWISNVGYGTKYHVQALREHGVCSQHRDTFVRTALSKYE